MQPPRRPSLEDWNPERHFAALDDPLHAAFPGRRPILPWQGSEPVPEADLVPTWSRLRRRPRAGPAVAYVHVPFCAGHCSFCGFYQNGTGHPSRTDYHELVARELELEPGLTAGPPIEALYFGGGTPSALDTDALVSLITSLREQLPLAVDAEITLETRALHGDPAKLRACIDAGVNRVSVGVQSFDTEVRRGLGRRADRATLLAFLEDLRSDSRAALVIDLIFGLPGQSRAVWHDDLATCVALAPDGVDLYALSLHPGIPLFRMAESGACARPALVAEQADLYALGVATLERAGWCQLTQAHFASGSGERNLYNQHVKRGAECIGFGSGAGGTHAGYAYAIESELGAYGAALQCGQRPVARLARLSPTHRDESRIVDGFERGILDLGPLAGSCPHFPKQAAPLLEQWSKAGLVELRGESLVPTVAGRFWQSNLIAGLIECIRSVATLEGEPR